jgi:hypothetical protein
MLCALVALVIASATFAAGVASSRATTVALRWTPTATRFWHADGHAVTGLFDNGQCTEWAERERPDIVRRGIQAIVARELARHQPESIGDWDARDWPANARLAHTPTGHAPRARALVVFAPGTLGAGAAGHIAYVERVLPDGSFRVSEMHAPALGRVTHRHLPAADARRAGVTFIY